MYSGIESNRSIAEVVPTPATASTGVTPTPTSSPASTLPPTKPRAAPVARRIVMSPPRGPAPVVRWRRVTLPTLVGRPPGVPGEDRHDRWERTESVRIVTGGTPAVTVP